jgi:hypothetical protein
MLTVSFLACAMNPSTALATARNATTTDMMVITLLLAIISVLAMQTRSISL